MDLTRPFNDLFKSWKKRRVLETHYPKVIHEVPSAAYIRFFLCGLSAIMTSAKMRTKVFHVITKLELGGAQKVTLMTLERLPRDRYELVLATGPEGLLVDWANRIPDLRRIWIPSMVREIRPIQDVLAMIKLWRLFRKERPKVVHTHTSKAGIIGRWAAKLAGVPFIFHTAHGFGFNDFQRPAVRNIYIALERITAKITTKLFLVSYANADKAEKCGMTRRGEWVLARDSISVQEFLEPRPRRQMLSGWGIPTDKVIVGMVACFKPQKSPEDFVEVAARVLKKTDRAHFVMAGDGELRESIEERIRTHGIEKHITLLGWQTEKDMPEVYRNLDVVVLTSLWEGLPCVFSEAMACELPIVATNVDGAREAIIDQENGYLHEPHNVEGMASSVLKLITDPNLCRKMGQRGKSRVMEFDIGTSVAVVESTYRQCLNGVAENA
jgi:glycosyltransferase involved in cell wall biosynthesis